MLLDTLIQLIIGYSLDTLIHWILIGYSNTTPAHSGVSSPESVVTPMEARA